MDVKEFKAWFEGFCESIGEAPTPEQFAKIKAKVQGLETPPKMAYREPQPRTWLSNGLVEIGAGADDRERC